MYTVHDLTHAVEATQHQEAVLDAVSKHFDPPIWYASDEGQLGFIYTNPTAVNFCLLKLVRSVSAINACILLTSGGFTQEILVILRTVAECVSLSDYIAVAQRDGGLTEKQKGLVKSYFYDYQRTRDSNFKGKQIRQVDIHKKLGKSIDNGVGIDQEGGEKESASRLLSNIYMNFSNYVHARYPEAMDLWGGREPHFHMDGMSGTVKDDENVRIINVYCDSVSLAVITFIDGFDLERSVPFSDESLHWLHNHQFYQDD